MKKLFIILLLTLPIVTKAQSGEAAVTAALNALHEAMVKQDTVSISRLTDNGLNYGHSNGWVESKTDFIKDMLTNVINYHKITMDSLTISMSDNIASARFTADISVNLRGVDGLFHLRVLEVWVKKGDQWKLFSRQGVK